MSTSHKTTTDQAQTTESHGGLSSVMSVGVRVAGRVPTRLDLRFAGTPQQQLGLSLGTVLVYVSSYLTARTVALDWGEVAAQARSLSPVLPGRRRPAMVSGPWSVAAMVTWIERKPGPRETAPETSTSRGFDPDRVRDHHRPRRALRGMTPQLSPIAAADPPEPGTR